MWTGWGTGAEVELRRLDAEARLLRERAPEAMEAVSRLLLGA